MELLEAIKGRRSCRNFAEDEVTEDDVEKIVNSARWAPSPANNQPWEFIVVRDEQIMKEIRNVSEEARKKVADESGWEWLRNYSVDFITEPPILIVVLSDSEREGAGRFFGKEDHIKATSCAVQNMLLRIHSLGYEGIWFSMYREEEIKGILDIPEKFKVPAIIPIGKPASDISTPKRKDLDQIIHKEKF